MPTPWALFEWGAAGWIGFKTAIAKENQEFKAIEEGWQCGRVGWNAEGDGMSLENVFLNH